MKPSILILHASGTNRDAEAARACELAGGAPEIVHINQVRRGDRRLADYQMLLLPGGFSYGDALGAGARLALDLQIFFHAELHAFVDSGKPVLGICNGFQTLVKAGLLPGDLSATRTTQVEQSRTVTLTENASGHVLAASDRIPREHIGRTVERIEALLQRRHAVAGEAVARPALVSMHRPDRPRLRHQENLVHAHGEDLAGDIGR